MYVLLVGGIARLPSRSSVQDILGVVLGGKLHACCDLLLLQRIIQSLHLLVLFRSVAELLGQVVILLLKTLLLEVHG